MTFSDKLILQGDYSRNMPVVVTKMWVAGVHAGLDPLFDADEYPDLDRMTHLRNA